MKKPSVIALSLTLLCLVHNTVSDTDEFSSGLPAVTISKDESVSQSALQNPSAPKLSEDSATIALNVSNEPSMALQDSSSTPKLSEDSTKITTKQSNEDSQPLKSKICEVCVCQDATPFLINCTAKGLRDPFLHSDWPLAIHVSSIEVRFDSNDFVEIPQFPELPIVKLSYRSNHINMIQKGAFKFLKGLEYLDLSGNSLTRESLGSSIFEGPFNEEDNEPIPLKVLKLGYNKITSIDKDAFDHLSTHLEELELNNNRMKTIDHQTAMAITTLRKLKVILLIITI